MPKTHSSVSQWQVPHHAGIPRRQQAITFCQYIALPSHFHCIAIALPLHCHCIAITFGHYIAFPWHCYCIVIALPLQCIDITFPLHFAASCWDSKLSHFNGADINLMETRKKNVVCSLKWLRSWPTDVIATF